MPGECVRSIVNRHCLRSSMGFMEVLAAATNRKKIRLHPQLPCFLTGLSTVLGTDANDLLQRHTLFPLYGLFLDANEKQKLAAAMMADLPLNVSKVAKWGANQLKSAYSLNTCPKCTRDGIRRYGVSYWHLKHQIPGVLVCYRHGCKLQGKRMPTSGWDTLLNLPMEGDTIAASAAEIEFAQFVGLTLDLLLEHEPRGSPFRVFNEAARELGILTRTGNVRRKKLLAVMDTWNLAPIQDCGNFNKLKLSRKFARLLRQDTCNTQHVLTNLVFAMNLLGRPEKFFVREERDEPKTNTETGTRAQLQASENHCLNLLNQGRSMNQVSQLSGRSRCYLKRLALRNSLTINLLPRHLSDAKRQQALVLAKAGLSNASIVETLQIKKSAVEFILSCSPEIQKFRKLLSLRRRQVRYRDQLEVRLASNAMVSRTTIAKLEDAAFHWLYRNDRRWLHKMLPPARKRIIPVRVDWVARDKELLQKVKVLNNSGWYAESWAVLDREFGGHGWFTKYRDKLPESVAEAHRILTGSV